ncbi:hypothetical protein FB451DRAFT_1389245 [Mycena latifolia]|nr:hypothetical protein FB451DRAFT_1389245 [Mycena latifolia]
MPYVTDAADLRLWIGCLLAGTWVNIVLFTTEVALFVYYIPKWNLHLAYRYWFYVVIANDLLATCIVCANLYTTIVDNGSRPSWLIAILLLSSGISAFMEQTFLIHRYYTVARSIPMSAILMLLVVAHFGVILAAVYGGLSFKAVFGAKVSACIYFVSASLCAAADVLIALSIVWSLSGIRPMWRSTQQLIRVLCINALTSGAVVASVTLLAMVTQLVEGVIAIGASLPFPLINLLFILMCATQFSVSSSMGRVYSLTILVNIVVRNSQRDVVNSVHVTEFAMSTMESNPRFHTASPHSSAPPRARGSTDESGSHTPPSKLSPLPGPSAPASLRLSLPDPQSRPRTPYIQSPGEHSIDLGFTIDRQRTSYTSRMTDSPPNA